MESHERLKAVRKTNKLNQTAFAKALGMDQSHLSAIEVGKKRITMNIVILLNKKFDISSDWLLFGKGEMNNKYLTASKEE